MRRPGLLADGRPGPFLKWVGGKGQLLAQYAAHFPPLGRGATYHEPFLGGGAVFFHLGPKRARLSDVNEELINCWQCVRDQPREVVERVAWHRERHGKEHFYEVRALDLSASTPVERAARFIYLNRTCFNGLWRVNSSGRFNVPMGRYANPLGLIGPAILAAAKVLRDSIIDAAPFEHVLEVARRGDFVYFDPPYMPLSSTANFTSYSKDAFSEDDQRRLAKVFATLTSRGVRAALSNAMHPVIESLYRNRKDYRVIDIRASRVINSNAARRGAVGEVLVLNFSE